MKRYIMLSLMMFLISMVVACGHYPYTPLSSNAESMNVYDVAVLDDELDTDALNSIGKTREIIIGDDVIRGVYLYDSEVLDDFRADLYAFYESVNTIPSHLPWDIVISVHEEGLEVIVNALFDGDREYSQKHLYVSRSFGLLFPYLGGIHFTDRAVLINIAYLLGVSQGMSSYVSPDNPVTFYYFSTPAIENASPFYLAGSQQWYALPDFNMNKTLNDFEEVDVIEYLLIAE